MFVIIEAPVVVNPLTISKKASVKLLISPLIQKGNAPMADIVIQARATITKPSFAKKVLSAVLPARERRNPAAVAMAIVAIKDNKTFISP